MDAACADAAREQPCPRVNQHRGWAAEVDVLAGLVVVEGDGQGVALLGRLSAGVVGEGRHDGQPVVGALQLVEGDRVVQVGEGARADDQRHPPAVRCGGDLFDQGAQRRQAGATGDEEQIARARRVEAQAGIAGWAEPEQLAGAYLMDQAVGDGAGGYGADVQLDGAVRAWGVGR